MKSSKKETQRLAACRCGRVELICVGEPERISVCHCLACQRRTGSAFSTQARFAVERVTFRSEAAEYWRVADSGRRAIYRFCPHCGSTVAYSNESAPGLIAIPFGNFLEPIPHEPTASFYEKRQKSWLRLDGLGLEHFVGDD